LELRRTWTTYLQIQFNKEETDDEERMLSGRDLYSDEVNIYSIMNKGNSERHRETVNHVKRPVIPQLIWYPTKNGVVLMDKDLSTSNFRDRGKEIDFAGSGLEQDIKLLYNSTVALTTAD
jgi:hypothetical protein